MVFRNESDKRVDMATLKEIAELAGVSAPTVSRVLNGQAKGRWAVAVKRADRIRQIAKQLNYRPDAAARSMRNGKTGQIGVLAPNVTTASYEHEFLAGMSDLVSDAGYTLSLVPMLADKLDGDDAPSFLRQRQFDSVIAFNLAQAVRDRIAATEDHCIWLDTNHWSSERCLRRNEQEAGRDATRALLELGYRRIIYLGIDRWPDCHHCIEGRRQGVLDALVGADVSFECVDLRLLPEHLPAYLDWLLPRLTPDTGVVAWDVGVAEWCVHSAMVFGQCPGHDYGLSCCDDLASLSTRWPGLCRHTFPRREMGRMAARMAISLAENPQASCPSCVVSGHWQLGNTAWGPPTE